MFIREGLERTDADPVNILEVGFGTGLNALLTWTRVMHTGPKVIYHTIEKFRVEEEITRELNYPLLLGFDTGAMFEKLHQTAWNEEIILDKWFSLHKIRSDLITDPVKGRYDLVYFDAFSPGKQPGMWSADVFTKLFYVMNNNSILTTYAASGQVKRVLKQCGFHVESVAGPAGKRQMTRAYKP